MKKRIKPILLILLIIVTVFTGCKIERPDDVAEDKNSTTQVENTVKDSDSTKTKEDIKNTDDTKKDDDTAKNKTAKSEASKDNKDNKDNKGNKDNKAANSNDGGKKAASSGKSNSKQSTTEKSKEQLLVDANKHRQSGTKDKYLTDPTPEGMPKPIEWQGAKIDKSKVRHCTLSVDCLTILDNMKDFNKNKMSVLPKDGIIYKERRVIFYEGESVFDVLNREMKKNRIHMEFSMTPIYNSNYIEGIHNLYEFDCGRYSGWMYKVNGWYPNYGCSRYRLKDGDVINWRYTCDLGRDVGCTWMSETLDD